MVPGQPQGNSFQDPSPKIARTKWTGIQAPIPKKKKCLALKHMKYLVITLDKGYTKDVH
jgi:hypothetical protein